MGLFDFMNRATLEHSEEFENRNLNGLFSNTLRSEMSNIVVDEDSIRRISSVEACLELICSSIAQLPVKLYKENVQDGSIEKIDDYREVLLNEKPNDTLNAYNLKKHLVKDYMLYGGSYVVADKRGNEFESIHLLPSRNISIEKYIIEGYKYDADIVYRPLGLSNNYSNKNNNHEVIFKPYEVMRILKESEDGITSKGLLHTMKEVFAVALHELEYSLNILNNGTLPLGLLETPNRLTQQTAERLRNSWSRLYQNGSRGAGNTIILEEGLSFKNLSLDPSSIQLVESKKISTSEICRAFGVPESMINSSANKYGSLEANNLHFLQYTLTPILTAIENALNNYMLLEAEKEEGYFFAFDTSEMLKSTQKEQFEAINTGLKSGVLSLNEARYRLNLSSIDNADYLMLSLGNVLYNKDTGDFIVPNMGLTGSDNNNENEDNIDDVIEDEKEEKAGVE